MKYLFTSFLFLPFIILGSAQNVTLVKDWNSLKIHFYPTICYAGITDPQNQTYSYISLFAKGQTNIIRRGPFGTGSMPQWSLGPIAQAYDPAYELRYNRLWAISKEDIQTHISQFQTPGYQMPEVIMNWPAHGNVANGEPENMAPFIDVNGNGSYDPYLGDYPAIKGDFAVYVILNSWHGNESFFDSLVIKLEYSGLYYLKNGIDAVFLEAKITNRENQSYTWFEPSFLFGSDMDKSTRYYTDTLNHTVFANDSSEVNSNFGRFAFTYFCDNALTKSMPVQGIDGIPADPDIDWLSRQWYALDDKWYLSGSPLYLPPSLEYSGTLTNYYAPYGIPESDSIYGRSLRGLFAKTRFTDIPAGESVHIKAVLHTVDAALQPVNYAIQEEILTQANAYRINEEDNGNCMIYLNTSNFPTTEFSVYPNPASTVLHLKGITDNCSVEFTDIYGHTLISHSHAGTVDVSFLNSGLYILRVRNNKNAAPILQSKVIISR